MRFLRTLIVCLIASAICRASDVADSYFKAAQKAERAGDILNAYLLYARASALEPANATYAAKKTSLRLAAMQSSRSDVGPDPARIEEAPSASEGLTAREVAESRHPLPVPELAAPAEKKSFDLKGDARTIFENVMEAYGVQVIFEADYQSPPPFTFRLNDADFKDALRALELVSNSFAVPMNAHLALVARDTQAKRTERMPMVAAAIPVGERMSAQDAQEMMTAVQQSLDIRRAQFDPTRHLVIMRDQAGKIAAAQELFAVLSQIRPQIEIDVQFLEFDKTSSLGYGISLPHTLSVVDFVGPVALPVVFDQLKELTGAATPYGVGIGNANILATLARASAVDLFDAQMVALDGQAATLHVGERYPIATNQYVGNTSGVTGTVYAPPPTVTFEDLGLVLKITPSINEKQEITLDLESQVKSLGAVSPVSGIPIINNRSYKAMTRLREGEWAVIAGLIEFDDSDVRNGFPGLMGVPVLGRLFAQNNIEHDTTQVLLVLKPHITAAPAWENGTHSIWVGTETHPVTMY